MNVELDLSHYAKRADIRNATGNDTQNLLKKWTWLILNLMYINQISSNLRNLKSKVDKLDIRKLETTPVDLSNLSNVLRNDVIKKTECNELVKKVNSISTTDTSNLV